MKSLLAMIALVQLAAVPLVHAAGEEKVELTIVGGHDTDPQDRGRPVVLVAAGLGVTPEVFREAFSRVSPAPAGTAPEPARVQSNKAALLGALARYGVTNDLLDSVSNYYRYRRERGEMWPTKPAAAYAILKDGAVASVVISDPGSGYSSNPAVTVPGHPEITLEAALTFDRDLKKNGAIVSVKPIKPRPNAP